MIFKHNLGISSHSPEAWRITVRPHSPRFAHVRPHSSQKQGPDHPPPGQIFKQKVVFRVLRKTRNPKIFFSKFFEIFSNFFKRQTFSSEKSHFFTEIFLSPPKFSYGRAQKHEKNGSPPLAAICRRSPVVSKSPKSASIRRDLPPLAAVRRANGRESLKYLC